MRTRPSAAGVVALALLVTAGCSTGRGARVPESQASRALPDADPTSRTVPYALRPLARVERVTVKLATAPGGGVRVVEFLSPDLTDAEKAELVQAIEGGALRPETSPERPASTWVTTVVRNRR